MLNTKKQIVMTLRELINKLEEISDNGQRDNEEIFRPHYLQNERIIAMRILDVQTKTVQRLGGKVKDHLMIL